MRLTALLLSLFSIPGFAQSPGSEVEEVEQDAQRQDTQHELTTAEEFLVAIDQALADEAIQQASTLLDQAFQCETISRAQLSRMTQLRAAFAYANGELGQLERSLAGLATLDAELEAGLAPPPVQARYAEVRESSPELALDVEVASEVVDGVRVARLVSRVDGDPGRLVHGVRIRAALEGAPLRLLGSDDQLELGDPHEPINLDFTLEALGVGGAVVGRRGAPDSPVSLHVEALPKDRTFLYVTLATIAVVVVAGAIGFGFAWVLTDGFTRGDDTEVSVR